MRFQNLHAVGLQKFMNRVFGVLQVGKLASGRRAHLAARGRESLGDPVIAESAFVRSLCVWIDEAAPVRACLHAIAAAKAVLLVYEHDAVGTDERCAHRTYLRAGGVSAVVAQLG